MLIPGQYIETHWTNSTKNYYEGKGYVFTKNGETLLVKAEDLLPTSKIMVDIRCDYCGDTIKTSFCYYINQSKKRIPKFSCKKCNGLKKSESIIAINKEKYINTFMQVCKENGYIPLATIDDCNDANSLLEFICPVHGKQSQTLGVLKKEGCRKCKKEANALSRKQLIIDNFHELCKAKNYTPISTINDIQNEGSWFYYICPQHGEQKIHMKDFKRGQGCPICRYEYNANQLKLSIDEVQKQIESKNHNKLLNKDEYVRSIENNLRVLCGNCGNVFTTSLNNYQKNHSGKCPECNERSQGEAYICDVLDKYHISYEHQMRFDDCRDKRTLPFDFYLNDYNTIVEFDGVHHYFPVFSQEHFEKTLRHDEIKNKYCKDHGIRIIRIPYWEFNNIEKILIKELNVHNHKMIVYPIKKIT